MFAPASDNCSAYPITQSREKSVKVIKNLPDQSIFDYFKVRHF